MLLTTGGFLLTTVGCSLNHTSMAAASILRLQVADCTKFTLNTDPAAPFGMCMCGRLSQEHTEAAKGAEGDAAGKKRTDAEAQARGKLVE